MQIGEQIRKARESKKLSQDELAHLLGITQKTVSNIENGKSMPSLEQLSRLSKELELDILQLLSHQGITFQQYNNQNISNSGIAYHQYPTEMLEMYQQLLAEKDLRIATLEKLVEELQSKQK